MKRRIVCLAAAGVLQIGAASSPASAQTFQSFSCADGATFVAAFLRDDPKFAHLQIDGKAVALKKRFTLTGSRYTARGISLTITKSGKTTLRHGNRGPTACTRM